MTWLEFISAAFWPAVLGGLTWAGYQVAGRVLAARAVTVAHEDALKALAQSVAGTDARLEYIEGRLRSEGSFAAIGAAMKQGRK